ncbi:MAG: hypothetical protein PVH80_02125, partial [Anaerolineae bacterium]
LSKGRHASARVDAVIHHLRHLRATSLTGRACGLTWLSGVLYFIPLSEVNGPDSISRRHGRSKARGGRVCHYNEN